MWLEDVAETGAEWSMARFVAAASSHGELNGAYASGFPLPESSRPSGDWLRRYVEYNAPTVDLLARSAPRGRGGLSCASARHRPDDVGGTMTGVEYGKLFLGIAVWVAVAIFAVIIQASVDDQLIGFFPVLAAVVAAWAIGELVVHPEDDDRS